MFKFCCLYKVSSGRVFFVFILLYPKILVPLQNFYDGGIQ